jgi:plasmid maintenance system killer protein
LIHLIRFQSRFIYQSVRRQRLQRMTLQAMLQFQQTRAIDLKLTRQLCHTLALGNAAQDQDQLRRPPTCGVENRTGERIEHRATAIALIIHHRFAMTPVNPQALACAAARAHQTLRMKKGDQTFIASTLIHQLRNREVHRQLLLEQPTLEPISLKGGRDKAPAKEHEPRVER